jgi:hypothetical protein
MRTGRHLSQTDGLCTLYRVTGDAGDDWTAHECVGMAKTPEIAEAICEAVNARGIPLPTEPPVPSASQIRAWLPAHKWTPGSAGEAGMLWHPPDGGHAVGIPCDDSDPFLTAGALKRIAERSHLTVGHLTQEMRGSDG